MTEHRWRPIRELHTDEIAKRHACVVVKYWRDGKRQVDIAWFTVSGTWSKGHGAILPTHDGYEYCRLPEP
jgi:hypothetical protein